VAFDCGTWCCALVTMGFRGGGPSRGGAGGGENPEGDGGAGCARALKLGVLGVGLAEPARGRRGLEKHVGRPSVIHQAA